MNGARSLLLARRPAIRYPARPAIDHVGPEVTEAHVDLQLAPAEGTTPASSSVTSAVCRPQAIYAVIEDELDVPYVVRGAVGR